MNKGLQKVTESKMDIEWLMGLKKITLTDLYKLTQIERDEVDKIMNKNLNTLTGVELEKFIEQFEGVWNESTKNQVWENNHSSIIKCINNFISQHGVMPSKSWIADITKLSRNTVHKHFAQFKESTSYKEQLGQFEIMKEKVMAVIFREAMSGNIKACRLYLDMIGGITKPNQKEVNTNNYIQINNTILNAEVIKGLNENQLKQIEQIVLSCNI